MLDGEERARGGIVHGAVAAGFGDPNIFYGAIAIDGESERGFGATGGADSGIDGVLQPVLIDGATNGFDVPAIARGEIAATLALHGNAAVERAGLIGIAGGDVHLAALAVRNGVGRRRGFLFEDFGLFAGRKNFFFVELGNIGGVFGRLGRFRLRLFDVEALGGIDDLGFGGIDGGRHGNACAGGEGNFYASVAAADSAPGVAGALEPDAGEKDGGERYMEEDRVGEVAFEAEVFRGVDGFGHGSGVDCGR